MLQNSVEPATLDLLKKLLALKELEKFYLVGGTALALKYNHRLSVDLDLFSTEEFDKEIVLNSLLKTFPAAEYRADSNPIGLFCMINNIKVDIIKNHYFKQIDTPDIIDGIRMFGDKDLIAKKIFAILKRARKKDFYDIAELLIKNNIKSMIEYYKLKYPDNMLLISIPTALTYFADAEEDVDPVSLNGNTWDNVKKTIQQNVNEYFK